MENILVVNDKVLSRISNPERLLIQSEMDNNFQRVRTKVMQIINHNEPSQGRVRKIKNMNKFLKTNKAILTKRERTDIANCKQVFYYGEKAPFKYNCFDLTEFKIGLFEQIDFRYEVWNYLGGGTYGVVIDCYDHKYNQFVAIKVIKSNGDKKTLFNEIDILAAIKKESKKYSKLNYPFIQCKRTFSLNGFIYFIFEKLAVDIERLLKTHKLCPGLVRYMSKSLMEGLHTLKKLKIIHLDLKTNNILLTNDRSNIKICDFGLSTFYSKLKRGAAEAQCLPFRAPEAILGGPIGYPLDMWAAAVIIVELKIGTFFLPGENTFDQLTKMIEVFGVPPKRVLQSSKHADKYFYSNGIPRYCSYKKNSDGRYIMTPKVSLSGETRDLPGSRKLESVLRSKNKHFIDFLSKCFEWDPTQRMTPEQALEHPYIKDVGSISPCKLLICNCRQTRT